MRLCDPSFPLSPERFRLLRDHINRRFGIYFGDDDRYLVESRLAERLVQLEIESFDDYHNFLLYNPSGEEEAEQAAEILTTNETYFFREEYQLRAFAREVLPRLRERLGSRRRLMIWSAGCSSGEEAYTIAMIVLDSGLFQGWDVRIFGSDLSSRMLAKARRGIFGGAAFRTTPEAIQRRHFVEVEPGQWRIGDDVRALCHFGHLNLLDEEKIVFVGRADAVFCRNVLIYFDKRSKRKGINILYDRLSDGGYLLLGHTESLLNLSTAFEIVHLSEDLVYRRPEVGRGA
ncbi:MAG: protein-glutamate O-methyltransferase CheR [Proteobacteria bacterium]|jgi:chemotaxis protein methyltransferase CheR|nr:protein-glutamate O-methyltransferase CheR [Pseudomonadota bacterium]